MKGILQQPIATESQCSSMGPRKDYYLMALGMASVREINGLIQFHGSKFPEHKNKMSKQFAIIRTGNALHLY